MIPGAKTHSLTFDEIEKIKALGFQFEGIATLHEEFINTNFPNLNLLLFSKLIDDILSPLCHKAIFKFIHLNDLTPPVIHFDYYTDDNYDQINGLALSRIFSWENGKLIVTHDYFLLPESSRGMGIAKQVFSASLQQYVNMGVKKILVHAALQDGGYVWARNFFSATNQDEIRVIINDARLKLTLLQFEAVNRIYTNYYTKNPAGNAFPIVKWAELPFMKDILRGSSWHGLIDFDNQEQFSNFTSHVFQ